jgi:hypothetical protein
MKNLWFALVFFAGGFAHEVRNPVSCQCISSRRSDFSPEPRRPTRKRSPRFARS